MPSYIDLTGMKFGRLTVLCRTENRRKCRCLCDCGNETDVYISHLRDGHTQSCGCLHKELLTSRLETHRLSKTRLYKTWSNMKTRCNNENNNEYAYYGGRGIKVCPEWEHDFGSFAIWALSSGYRDDLTIDRIDCNGNYSPENCRWATRKEQGNNTRRNHYLSFNGQIKTISEWSDEVGLSSRLIQDRIVKLGWSVDRALTTPKRKQRRLINAR